jgi:hypothetical protein
MVAEINADRAMLINSIVELGEPRRAKQSAAPDGDRRLLSGDVRSRALAFTRNTHGRGPPFSRSRVLTSGRLLRRRGNGRPTPTFAIRLPRLRSPAVEPLARSHFVGAIVRVVLVLAIALATKRRSAMTPR